MLSAAYIALTLMHPNMAESAIVRYSTVMEEQAAVIGIDPLVFVAIAEHETRFNQYAVSPDREDWGLMQVRARYYSGKPEWLFNATTNIQAAAHVIKETVSMCDKHLGRPSKPIEWISCYVGACGVKRNFCKPTRISKKRSSFAECLTRAVADEVPISKCESIYN